jgi:hypothetical protein
LDRAEKAYGDSLLRDWGSAEPSVPAVNEDRLRVQARIVCRRILQPKVQELGGGAYLKTEEARPLAGCEQPTTYATSESAYFEVLFSTYLDLPFAASLQGVRLKPKPALTRKTRINADRFEKERTDGRVTGDAFRRLRGTM